MYPLQRFVSRTAAVLAATFVGTSLTLAAPLAQAADPQVCSTGKAPTLKTQPWYDFAHTKNTLWATQPEFKRFVVEMTADLAKLGPSSSGPAVEAAVEKWGMRLETVSTRVMLAYSIQLSLDVQELFSALALVDPAGLTAAMEELEGSVDADRMNAAVETLSDYADGVSDILEGLTAPLPGPVVLPSPTSAIAAVGTLGMVLDELRDFARSKVVYSGTRTTCAATASLHISATSASYGAGRTLTFKATKAGKAVRGDYTVVLDGRSLNSGLQESTFTATLPTATPVGARLLTVAFVPVDGSPISVRTINLKVVKARTKTTLKLSKKTSPRAKAVKATVRVKVPGTSVKAKGTATLKVGKKTIKVKVRNGKGQVKLRQTPLGKNRIKAVFTATKSLKSSASKKVTLRIK